MTDQVTFCFIIHFGKQMGEPQFISIRFRKKSYSAAATATLIISYYIRTQGKNGKEFVHSGAQDWNHIIQLV